MVHKMRLTVKTRLANRICLYLFMYYFSLSCKDNSFNREEKMINQYHQKTIEYKGDSLYFISKSEIKYLMPSKSYPIDSVKINDNVSFFDSNGNIVYQTICRDIKGDSIYLECFSFDKNKDYLTPITKRNFSNIKDLKRFRIVKVMTFRD